MNNMQAKNLRKAVYEDSPHRDTHYNYLKCGALVCTGRRSKYLMLKKVFKSLNRNEKPKFLKNLKRGENEKSN